MCDCYMEPCKACGKPQPVHLGDFLTDRFELYVVCEDCLSDPYYDTINLMPFNMVLWNSSGTDGRSIYYLFVYLTDNAWKYWEINHPNESYVRPVLIIPK